MKKPPIDLDLLNSFWWRTEVNKEWRIYNSVVKQARAFTLDDEAVETIAAMAFKGHPMEPATERRLDGYRSLARLPYPVMWIEYDYRVLDRWMVKKGIPHDRPMFGKPERVGYLLDRIEANNVAFRIMTLGKMTDLTDRTREIGASMFPINQTVTNGPLKIKLTPHPSHVQEYRDALESGNKGGLANAVAWGLIDPKTDVGSGALDGVVDNALYMTGEIEPEEMTLEHLRVNTLTFYDLVAESMFEQSLDLRFVVAALALLNHVPVKYVGYRRPGHARPRIEQRPFLSTSIITINVPVSRRRLREINEHLKSRAGGWHNRRHEVRGHWRIADREVSDKWERFYDPEAETFRWRLWIKEHERGDSSLGSVQQYHHVVGVGHHAASS